MALNLGNLAAFAEQHGDLKQKVGKDAKDKAVATGKPLAIPLEHIAEDANQPRKQMQDEELQELAQNIKAYGVKQPILLRSVGANQYVIIAGHRRFRAAGIAGLTTIPALLEEGDIDDKTKMILQLSENLHREDLTALEIAEGLQALVDAGIKQKDIATTINKSKVFVSEHLSMLKLPAFLLDAYRAGKIESLRALMDLKTPSAERPEEIEAFVNVHEGKITEAVIRDFLNPKPITPETASSFEDMSFGTSDQGAAAGPQVWEGHQPGADGFMNHEAGEREPGETAGPQEPITQYPPEPEPLDIEGPKSGEKNRWKKPTFKVEYQGHDALIQMHEKCSNPNSVIIKLDFDGHTEEVEIAALNFKAIQEAD
jgi:ParB family chromosome partitioning protein